MKTVVFVGRSGVGKSSIINFLNGLNVLNTQEIRNSDKRGKHTTTHKQLVKLKNGVNLIDSPGIKEIKFMGRYRKFGMRFLQK